MIQTLSKNWWLLVVCGVLYAVISFINFGHAAGFHAMRDVFLMGRIALAAGACTIVAALWGSRKGSAWFLALNGLALIALGLLLSGIAGSRISLLPIALLVAVMAITLGIVEFDVARAMRHLHHLADGWVLVLAGVVTIAAALPLVALGLRWVTIAPGSSLGIVWFSLYFGFSAICMLVLAFRLHNLRGLLQPASGAPA